MLSHPFLSNKTLLKHSETHSRRFNRVLMEGSQGEEGARVRVRVIVRGVRVEIEFDLHEFEDDDSDYDSMPSLRTWTSSSDCELEL